MYAFITGVIEEKTENAVILNNNGMGYEINASAHTINSLPPVGEVGTLFTYLHVREDAFMLFGFSTKQEKEIFLQLITVSGIGAKSAVQILSGASPEGIVNAIITGDVKLISGIKGIGKKTAERIILELKGKFGDAGINMFDTSSSFTSTATEEATLLLTNMGLTRNEAVQLVKSVADADDTTEQIVTKALRNMH